MAVTVAQFQTDFPEFSDTTRFPPASVQFWLTAAGLTLNAAAWGTWLDMGTELYIAHHVTLAARDAASAATGGLPGQQMGPTASKSVDKVSVSYDTGAAAVTGAGFWNLTSYGTRFLFYSRMVGAGGIQVGTPGAWPGGPGYVGPLA